MNNKVKKKKRESHFHVVKRDGVSFKFALGIRLAAIGIALLIISLFTFLILKVNPLKAFYTMLDGVFGPFSVEGEGAVRFTNSLESFRKTAILLCIGIGLVPAFKMKFWNTGAEGQVLMGCFGTAFSMYYFRDLHIALLIPVMLFFALFFGALWGVIPAIFKAFWGTNETLFTLMMNSVAACIILFFMKSWNKQSSTAGGDILDPQEKVYSVFGQAYWIPIVAVLLLAGIMFVYMKYSKQGYEISVVGESEKTAKYIGINVKKVIIRTMAISGLICGLAGFFIVAISQTIAGDSAGGQGFTAIMVAWLAKFNPLVMILSAFLFIFVNSGGQQLSTSLHLDKEYSSILIGILLFFIIGCEFFINYKIAFKKSAQAEAQENAEAKIEEAKEDKQ